MKPVLHGCAGVNLDRSYLMDSEADRYFGEGQAQSSSLIQIESAETAVRIEQGQVDAIHRIPRIQEVMD
jgi:hypothetical protein